MYTEVKMQEFGNLEVGRKFYLGKPDTLPEVSYYTKTKTQKDGSGSWTNCQNAFGLFSFVKYDKRVWVK